MTRGAFIAAMCLVASLAPSGAAATTVQERFQGGVEAYQAGRHDEAAATFRELVEKFGVSSPDLLVDLAAAEFAAGRPGPAVLALLRADRLAPGGATAETARVSLERVRSALNERAGASGARRPAFVFGAYHDAWTALFGWLSPGLGLGLFLGAWAATFGLLGAARLVRGEGTRRTLATAAAVLALVAALSGVAAYGAGRVAGYRTGVVLADAGLLPDVAATEASMTLPEGLELRVLGTRGNFVHVCLPSGQEGWLADRVVGLP